MKGLLAERLIALRKANGMTATQCAAELDVSIAAWSQWEKAKRDPPLKDLPKICWMFGVSMDNLFGLSDSCCHSGNNSVSMKNNSEQTDWRARALAAEAKLVTFRHLAEDVLKAL